MKKALGVTCGIGSMLIGARSAGFKVIGNIEWRKYYHHRDKQGRNTFTENFPNAFMANSIDQLEVVPADIDLVMGHPECGSYSILNQNRKETESDPGDIPLFTELINAIKPRFFVQDNLPRSLIGFTMKDWHKALPEYDLFPEWISNYNYGNIQKSRNRFFMIGALKKERFFFQPGERVNLDTLKDRLTGLRGLPNQNLHVKTGPCGKNRFNNSTKRYGQKVTDREITAEGTWENFQAYFKNQPDGHVMLYATKDNILRRRIGTSKGYWKEYSHLLDGSSAVSHPRKNLPFTIRERARIQGCPDDFIFYGEKLPFNHEKNSVLIKQTGKFMPVEFCTYIAKQIAAHIREKEFQSSNKRMIKPNRFIDDAKRWYCEQVGYRHQEKVCGLCWLACIGGLK